MARHAADGQRTLVAAGVVAALAVTMWIGFYRFHSEPSFNLNTVFPTIVLLVITFSVAVPGRRYSHRPMADGKVVAVIPAFNEDPDALHETIRSLLSGTRPPDEIHVVDDGSHHPIPEFEHPRVFWYRQPNGGKRKAQAHALRTDTGADFVLTVDSDCTVDRYAVQRLLQAMSDSDVQAATGLPLTRNRSSWLARLIDLEITSICLTYRAARSRLGSITTCSGALSLYRAGVVLDNLDDYVSAAQSHGDDRRLTHYAMLRGNVVSVADAVVHTDMPTRIKQLYRQRVRWSSSHWRYTLWEIAHLPTVPMLWSAFYAVLSVIVPVSLMMTLVVAPLLGHPLAWQFLAYWTVACWMLNLKYAVGRPQMTAVQRWSIWLLGTPSLVLIHLLVLRPAMIHALFKLRSSGWGTRGAKAAPTRRRARMHGRYRGARIPILADA
ncbi:glycosyltransferase family 2 protein [Phytoactinopolyspora halotolerans]|uniref:Hyaluronan synthase n=1 Tax=Phytoactinopolyspora halotolerans TaxID=1981512 RepID=A0A6L9SH47_9ACTN|nr:glycosyltransferase [Phytoactinopolyspora halotolerans]NEE04606.1 glycosyltransferase [Phytoactinopolyspora halotolerans]